MIRYGREKGHLTRPSSQLQPWAESVGVTFDGIRCDVITAHDGEERGSGLLATRELSDTSDGPLLVVPRELVLSKETVEVLAMADRDLRALMEALGDFVKTSRGAILTFLLYTATVTAARQNGHHLGTLTEFNQYINYLPDELLPTVWTDDEVSLLEGTSLHSALLAKQKSLAREFALLSSSTQSIRWCQDLWCGDDPSTSLTPADWIAVDAMYRSRALELPGTPDAMVPCVDMANHAPGDVTNARYEVDGNGDAVLLLREGAVVPDGQEINITYGDGKGACEMLFSYGFLDTEMRDAGELFVPLSMEVDDPLGPPKNHVCNAAPGVKFFREQGDKKVRWFSEYVFLVNTNEEDGLDFAIAETIEGERKLHMLFRGSQVTSTAEFVEALRADPLWDVHRLRAVVALAAVVEETLASARRAPAPLGEGAEVRESCRRLAGRLRALEADFLAEALAALEQERDALLSESEVIKEYLAKQAGQAEEEQETERAEINDDEDFT